MPPPDLIWAEIQRREAQEKLDAEATSSGATLAAFVRAAWHVLEPGTPYVHGWHIDVVCALLEAVTDGLTTRVLINIPPGTAKSLLVSVFWPAWEWGPKGMPHLRYFTTSYKETYVKRDSRRMRDLIQSDWYQARWPIKFLREGELSFENTSRGWREGVPFTSLTAGRGDRVILDDPHSTEQAESDLERGRALRIFRESVPSRVVDPQKSAIVVIMQRLHRNDLSGEIIDREFGYDHAMFPMEFEPDRRCVTRIPGVEDRRTQEGELLFPARFTRETVERDKIVMGSHAVAGQFQQRPTPRGGGLFKRHWFNFIPAAPTDCTWVRAWDLAATEGGSGAATAGVLMGRTRAGRFVIANCVQERGSANQVERLILATALLDAKDIGKSKVNISLPQDPGQSGKSQAQALVSMLAGFIVRATPESGDKITRAMPFSAQCEAGNVDVVDGLWVSAYLDELCEFPAAKIKDRVDASSRAFAELLGKKPSPTNVQIGGMHRSSPNIRPGM